MAMPLSERCRQSPDHCLAAVACALATVACVGCSTTATITRLNGPPVDVKIVGADATDIYVETPSGPSTIAKHDVTDIDHPGDTVATIGGILAGYGVVNIAVGVPRCKSESAAFCVGVFTPAVIGLPMLIWGLVVHGGSTSALHQPPPPHAAPHIALVPAVEGVDGTAAGGATFVVRY